MLNERNYRVFRQRIGGAESFTGIKKNRRLGALVHGSGFERHPIFEGT